MRMAVSLLPSQCRNKNQIDITTDLALAFCEDEYAGVSESAGASLAIAIAVFLVNKVGSPPADYGRFRAPGVETSSVTNRRRS
jgi:hypothetical protein